jgi:hypothetical protein
MRALPTYEQSFESIEDKWILRCWSEKNRTIPRNIFKFTKTLYIFHCKKCYHEFEQAPHIIANGSFCSYCSHHTLCNDDNCTFCFEVSLASYKKKESKNETKEEALIESKRRLSCWCEDNFDKEGNKITPRMVTKTSVTDKYKFKCYKCNHIFLQSPEGISKDRWCQYCCKPTQMLCNDANCKHCFTNSFASNKMSIYWSDKNEVLPRNVMKSTPTKKYIFNCDTCHNEFIMNTNCVSKGHWCPNCRNKTELKLYKALKEVYPTIKSQFYADWCKNEETNKKLPFDFVLEKYKIIIELDGEQHFTQVRKWNNNVDESFARDMYKMDCAISNGYKVIRITQKDVYNDNNDWYDKLIMCIEKLYINNNQTYFISSKDYIYDKYLFYIFNKYYYQE